MVTRTAIVICSPGKGKQFLQGAVKDISNIKDYLISPRGGSWMEREIFCLNNPSWFEVNLLLQSITSDYQFIYFAGHGCSDNNKARYLEFKDGILVEDNALFTTVSRQLIVIDACRVFYASISGISPPEEDLNYTGESSRILFDNYIQASAPGKTIIHATQDNAKAAEERHGRGGVFTLSLLVTALNFKTAFPYSGVDIKTLLPSVKMLLLKEGYSQTPCIAYQEGNLSVPFLIDVTQVASEKKNEKEHPPKTAFVSAPKKISVGRMVLIGVVAFAFFDSIID